MNPFRKMNAQLDQAERHLARLDDRRKPLPLDPDHVNRPKPRRDPGSDNDPSEALLIEAENYAAAHQCGLRAAISAISATDEGRKLLSEYGSWAKQRHNSNDNARKYGHGSGTLAEFRRIEGELSRRANNYVESGEARTFGEAVTKIFARDPEFASAYGELQTLVTPCQRF